MDGKAPDSGRCKYCDFSDNDTMGIYACGCVDDYTGQASFWEKESEDASLQLRRYRMDDGTENAFLQFNWDADRMWPPLFGVNFCPVCGRKL